MRTLLITLFSFVAIASGTKDAKFQMRKTKKLESLDKRISALTELKSCLSKAANHDQAKACNDKMNSFRKEMKSMRKRHSKGDGHGH